LTIRPSMREYPTTVEIVKMKYTNLKFVQ